MVGTTYRPTTKSCIRTSLKIQSSCPVICGCRARAIYLLLYPILSVLLLACTSSKAGSKPTVRAQVVKYLADEQTDQGPKGNKRQLPQTDRKNGINLPSFPASELLNVGFLLSVFADDLPFDLARALAMQHLLANFCFFCTDVDYTYLRSIPDQLSNARASMSKSMSSRVQSPVLRMRSIDWFRDTTDFLPQQS